MQFSVWRMGRDKGPTGGIGACFATKHGGTKIGFIMIQTSYICLRLSLYTITI